MAGLLAAGESNLFRGFKRELEKLNNTVSTIKVVLLDAERQQAKSEEVSLWLERLSDLLYEADDLLDSVSSEALRRKTQQEDAKRSLQIQWCPELKSLSPGIQHLTSLEHLLIQECPKLELPDDEHGMFWRGLNSLISLEVSGLLKCHILIPRYHIIIGFDWPKIAGIPDLELLSR